MLGITKS